MITHRACTDPADPDAPATASPATITAPTSSINRRISASLHLQAAAHRPQRIRAAADPAYPELPNGQPLRSVQRTAWRWPLLVVLSADDLAVVVDRSGPAFLAAGNSIGRITTGGKVTVFRHPSIRGPQDIAAGPDGALWFTNRDSIGRITTRGTVTSFRDAGVHGPWGIAAGADGALWFTNYRGHSIGRVTTEVASASTRHSGIVGPRGIARGPDGAVWFADNLGGSIGRITTRGAIAMFRRSGIDHPWDVAAGPDGAIWFGDDGNNAIGRIEVVSNS